MNLALRSDSTAETEDQFVPYGLGTLNRRGREFRMGRCVQIANFVDSKFRVWIGQTHSVVIEFTNQSFDLHKVLLVFFGDWWVWGQH